MRSRPTRLLSGAVSAVLAAGVLGLSAGAASADPLCVDVTYSVLGSGNTVGTCVPTPFPAVTGGAGHGNPNVVYVEVGFSIPLP